MDTLLKETGDYHYYKNPSLSYSFDCPSYYPPWLVLQWHITDSCNLSCKHCYSDTHGNKEADFTRLLHILDQYVDLLCVPEKIGVPAIRGHINITGGEPFIIDDFFKLLEAFVDRKDKFTFSILTNGVLIDRKVAKYLKKLRPEFVQVSIDGIRETHDNIRCPGNFDDVLSGVKHLVKAGVKTFVSFTACRDNYLEFPQVVNITQNLKVSRIWADRLIPEGRGASFKDQLLSSDETRIFFELMKKACDSLKKRRFNRTEVAMHRALQFLVAGKSTPYHCTAGDTLITIMPDGELYPCRRMPISVGNVFKTPLCELYRTSVFLRQLRDPGLMDSACFSCGFSAHCRGGLRCLSYALTNDPFKKDPGCWLGIR